jgi:hypothetical protein
LLYVATKERFDFLDLYVKLKIAHAQFFKPHNK